MKQILISPLVLFVAVLAAHSSIASSSAAPAATEEFKVALAEIEAAQVEFQNGRPASFKALWSKADDVTLAGGFGGDVEKGWKAVSKRLDWASAQFTNGSHENTPLTVFSNGDLGYVVQLERIRFTPSGSAQPTTREQRATMVLRREPEGWRIVHRHADAQVMKEAPH